MRGVPATAATVCLLIGSGCQQAANPLAPTEVAKAARLVLATTEGPRGAALLQPVDPDTLPDISDIVPVEKTACSIPLVSVW